MGSSCPLVPPCSPTEFESRIPKQLAHDRTVKNRRRLILRHKLFLSAMVLLWFVSFAAADPPDGRAWKVDYDRDVRPILAGRCQRCHGNSQANGGLRLNDSK